MDITKYSDLSYFSHFVGFWYYAVWSNGVASKELPPDYTVSIKKETSL